MKVLIADDHELVLDTLVAYIKAAGGIDVTTAPDFDTAVAKVRKEGPFSLVLLDLKMPGMNGLKGLEQAIAMEKAERVALLTGETSRALAEQALAAGAAGFVPKSLPARSVINAIRFMAMGEQYLPAGLMTREETVSQHPVAQKLTLRERQVLKALAEGKANKEIARDLDLSEPTVKLHIKTLYRKLDCNNRTQAALMAQEEGLI